MKKYMLLGLLFCSGCLFSNKQLEETSREDLILSTLYVKKMDSKQTTPEQDQRYIRATKDAFFSIYTTQVGIEKATSTRSNTEKLGE